MNVLRPSFVPFREGTKKYGILAVLFHFHGMYLVRYGSTKEVHT